MKEERKGSKNRTPGSFKISKTIKLNNNQDDSSQNSSSSQFNNNANQLFQSSPIQNNFPVTDSQYQSTDR